MKERSYSSLTRYIPLFDENQPARWRGRSNGFFTAYPAAVDRFVDAVCAFVAENADMALNRYHALLEKRGIKWEQYAMTRADVSRMDAQGVMALVVGAVRAERFCSGALGGFAESGCLRRWLERLAELDGGPSSQEDDFDF
ncbi:MAG: DUF6508 domain-containing protein [Clostridiales bacterium]|nr:DUF6508 domain-containing protein [Clostridiales bacterium]